MGSWVSCSSLHGHVAFLFFPSQFIFHCLYRVHGFWVSVLPFLFFPFILLFTGLSLLSHMGFWDFCSSLFRFMHFPLNLHTGLCVSCSSLLMFIKGYVFPVLPFTFSYRDMCFLFFPLHFHIGL